MDLGQHFQTKIVLPLNMQRMEYFFRCQQKDFSDGSADVCYPAEWYDGGGGLCEKVQDCGFSTSFGYKWMPCHGVCAQIRA
jgi:hypothetical protein